jgi:uncharacterized protein YutE (UPF0331/DUF86 family)
MVDEEIVTVKLRQINEYTNDLKEIRGFSREEYLEEMITQRAVERTLMNLVQACIDLAQHVRATQELSHGGTAKEEFEALGSADIISDTLQEKMKEAAGFRNVLAHRYGSVDHELVYDVLHNDLHWFEQFQQEIARWFQQYHS